MTAISRDFLRFLGLTVIFCCASAAQSGESFPRPVPDQNLIQTQQKVDELFEKGDYERAMFIYREELAPGGDKFAQYMVGYMYYTGRGVAEDQVAASAWYRLAAERGEESYMRVRDVLLNLLNDEQRSRSEGIYAELRSEMGDIELLSRLIEEDLSNFRRRRGDDPFSSVFGTSNFRQTTSDYKNMSVRLEQRTAYLVEQVAADAFSSDRERERVKLLQADVRHEIELFERNAK
jgi:TPR repeat protein